MNRADRRLSMLLLEVYEAAANPEHWDSVLTHIATDTEATKASIHVHSFAKNDWARHTSGNRVHRIGYDETASNAYAKYYAVRDPYIRRIRERFPREGSGTSADLITASELRQTEFYVDYGRANGIFYLGWTIIEQNERFGSGLSLIRPEDAKQFTTQQVEFLRQVNPHLAKAFRLQRIIDQATQSNQALLTSVAQFDFGVIALDQVNRITNISAPAKAILDMQDGIRIKGSRLEAVHPSEDQVLQEMIKGANNSYLVSGQRIRSSLLLSRQSGKRPLQLVVFPFSSPRLLIDEHPQVLVFLSDSSAKPVSRASALTGLYGLTPAECRLADLLLEGLNVQEAADRLRITLETARFHLKRVLSKTGARRQTELMRLMLLLPGRADRL